MSHCKGNHNYFINSRATIVFEKNIVMHNNIFFRYYSCTIFFVKLDFEIAVDQQTRSVTELLREFHTLGARRTATPIFGQFLA